jgi:Family of unknown function (DUF6519)
MKGDFSRQTFDAKKHYTRILMQQGRVQLDADWNEQQSIHQHRIATESKDVIGASGAPLRDAGFQISTADGKTLTIGRGRYYVEGVLCENESDTFYQSQPDFPNAPDVIPLLTSAQATAAIIYLDVWSRHVTSLDDPLIREIALGGPDTASRVRTVWQVKALPVKPAGGGQVSCGDSLSEWDTLVAASTGMLSARAQPTQAADSPCLLPPSAGYRRLENQLYRVEIHQSGALGAATFKWSRDNGAVVTAVESVNGQDVTVHDLGRDDVLGFAAGQWVELTDDVQELSGVPGQLQQIDHLNTATRVVSLKAAPAAVNMARHPKLRRWDSAGGLAVAVPTTNSGWIPLEDGVEIKFEAGSYKTGDYWLIPARTAIGDIEWPVASPQRPLGVTHHYSRLAVATLAGGVLTLQDCRKIFSALADAQPAIHVTGINWVNDDVVSQDFVQSSGLQVFFDNTLTPPPTDGSSGVVVVHLEMPLVVKPAATPTDAAVSAQFATILNGDISFPAANTLLWKPARGGAEIKSLMAFLISQQVSRVRLRYSLKGRALWLDQGNSRLYVDGQALGQRGIRADGTPRIDLQLPSGDHRRASDFESWFYVQLQLPSANLVGLSLNAPAVIAGNPLAGKLTLDFPAPASGVQVKLSSSAPQATVPATISIPAGTTQAPFTVTTTAQLASSINVIITATAGNVVLTTQFALQVISVAISPSDMGLTTGHSQQFTATVTGTNDPTVNWSVQEAGGGSVTSSGFYTAPAAAGTFHVVATSAADPSKKASATVRVVPKQKDKEKEKEKDKEKERLKEIAKEVEKIRLEVMPAILRPILLPGAEEIPSTIQNPSVGRAFIRPGERPEPTPFADPGGS